MGHQLAGEWYRRTIYAGRIAVNHWLFGARPALNIYAVPG